MHVKEIVLNKFRNIKNCKIEFDEKFNVIYGDNAQGKTSLIEAIYYVSTGKSFRTRKILEQIRENEKEMTVFSKTNVGTFSVQLSREKKSFYISKSKVRYKEYIGKTLVISFSPEDISLIMDAPENRRRFFNYEISQINPEYLILLIEFQKVIKIRNKLIKENMMETDIFKIYNEKFIQISKKIYFHRKKYINELNEYINRKYREIFDNKNLGLHYEKSCNYEELDRVLETKKEKEKNLGFTLYGPHKDEFSFILNGKKVKSFASQGEKKSVIFSLKLAQIEYIIEKINEKPVVLLDDISAYFDEIRKDSLIGYLSKKNIQCFFTSTNKLNIQAKFFYVKDGEIIENKKDISDNR